jgi:hypothetical protein
MQLMDQEFDAFLYIAADGILPEIFQIGNNSPAIAHYAAANGIEDFLVGVVDQME